MGNWYLEVFKMALYISFPVGMFHYFNQPGFYRDWVEESIKDVNKPETQAVKEFREQLKEFKKQQESQLQAELEKQAI